MQTEALNGFRLSLQQSRLWSLQQEQQVYCAQAAVLLQGEVDKGKLLQALQQIVERYTILQTVFHRLPGMEIPVQVIVDAAKPFYSEISLEGFSVQEQEFQIAVYMQMTRTNLFDLERGPLLHCHLVCLAPQRHVLVMNLAAMCADATTLSLLMQELSRRYAALQSAQVPYGMQDEDSDEPLQYVDVSAWQHDLLQEDVTEGLELWHKLDIAQITQTRLPLEQEYVREMREKFDPQLLEVSIEVGLWDRVQQLLAQRLNVSPDAVVLTCWQILLMRFMREPQVIMGVACDGRHYEELETTLGLCTQVLPIGLSFEQEWSFEQCLIQVDVALRRAVEQQEYFVWEKITAQYNQSMPFFPLSFEWNSWPESRVAGSLHFSMLQCYCCTERFALKLTVLQLDKELRMQLHYDLCRLTPAAVQQLAASLNILLVNALAQPQTPINTLAVLRLGEQERLLQALTGPFVERPPVAFHTFFEEQVERIPHQLAVVCNGEKLTYAELNGCANQLAHGLRKLGVGPQVMVGLCVERSVMMLVGLLGILKAGGAYVPLDITLPAARLAYQLQDIQCSLVLTQLSFLAQLPSWSGQYVCLDQAEPEWARETSENPIHLNSPSDLAYMIYTSGSTGTPKGVMIQHHSVVNYVQSLSYLLDAKPGWNYATVSTLAADLGNTAIFCSLASGGCLHVLPYEIVTDGQAFGRYMTGNSIDVLKIVPSHLEALLAAGEGKAVLPQRFLILGGEALSRDVLRQVKRAGGNCVVFNHYGPTEMTIGALVNQLDIDAELQEDGGTVPIGSPLTNIQAYILNEGKQIVPVGVTGELYLGGAGLAVGYLHQEELTRERFVFHAFSDLGREEVRLYRTGDLAQYRHNGQIQFMGRADNQVKIRGYRVELGEIEAVLGQYTNIRTSIVMLYKDEQTEQGLVAYIVPLHRPAPASEELRLFLQERLPAYMLPTSFVMVERLPLTANGKVDRKQLPAPQGTEQKSELPFLGPRSPVEEIVTDIWVDVLPARRVGVHDNFTSLGGHSLLATQVISRIRKIFQIELPLRYIFEFPTVAELAKCIDQLLLDQQHMEMPTFVAVPRDRALPLSFAQQRLWFLDQLEPASSSYNIPYAVRMQGLLNIAILERSLAAIVQRHEILRTTFSIVHDQPVQVINPAGTACTLFIDLSLLPSHEREREARHLAEVEALCLFDLEHGPLLRRRVLILHEQVHILLLTMHHIVSDGWSCSILMRELGQLYTAFVAGQPSPLPPLPIQYADFALWQRQWLQGAVLETQLDYWREQLKGIAPLELPTDRTRPVVLTSHGAEQRVGFSAALVKELKILSQREHVTLFMTMLASLQVLLLRYTGQVDIAVGTLIANRNQEELERLVGFLINALVLRTDLSNNPDFKQVLARVREVALGAYAHQHVPFEKIVEVLQPERDLSRSPFFQVMFVLLNTPQFTYQQLGDIKLSLLEKENKTTVYDIYVSLVEVDGGLEGVVRYNTDLFDAETLQRMLQHWQLLLEGIIAHPEQLLSELPLMTEDERKHLLMVCNQTDVEYGISSSSHLQGLFEQQVTLHPDTTALVFKDMTLTYGELNRRANQVARYLRTAGVGSETLVGICMERSLELVVGLFGILKAGGVYVPLDPSYPQERLAFIIADAQFPVLLLQEQLLAALPPIQGTQICLNGSWEKFVQQSPENLALEVATDQLAYMIYTSGSTGLPKGVMNTHGAICNRLLWMQEIYQLSADDRVLQKTPFSFDVSVWEFFWPLLTGACLVIAEPGGHQDSRYLATLLTLQNISTVHFVPSMLSVFLEEPGIEHCSALRQVICSGEMLPFHVQQRFFSRLATNLYNLYGPTEAAVDVSFWACEQESLRRVVPIGHPIANIQLYILDQYMQPVPVGVAGEIFIGGVGLARGYWRRASLTAERFVPDPFRQQPGGRLYRTGDVARMGMDGAIEYLGRMDHQVKLRGIRIEPGEIEATLVQCEAVQECVVLMREIAPGEQYLVAYLVSTRSPGNEDELRDYLQDKLPEYMLPSFYVWLDILPLSPNGKIDRRVLPLPDLSKNVVSDSLATPRNAVEEILWEIWQQVLHFEQLSIYADFFKNGGHSLLATQVISRIRRIFQIELSLLTIFENPTIAGLAKKIEQRLQIVQQREVTSIVAVSHLQPLPLSFAQQRLWFLDQLKPGNAAYNLPLMVRLHGPLMVQAVERSLNEIVQRHESLRTVFQMHGEYPVQVILLQQQFDLQYSMLQALAPHEREAEVLRLARHEVERPFHLTHGPLIRGVLLRLEREEHVLLLTLHHIVSDGWSMDILIRELSALYEAFVDERPSPLPALPLQYADFALWQRQALQGEVLDAQLDYWQKQLAGSIPLNLPTDHPYPSIQTFNGARKSLTLPLALTEQLKILSQREEVTLFMTLLAAFQTLLARYSGQVDISVGTPIANRTHEEIETLIGFFVNTLVLRSNLAGNPTFVELMKHVREVTLNAYAHQDVPFEMVVEKLQPERNLRRAPLFQVMFTLQNALATSRRELRNLTLQPLVPEYTVAKFDLAVILMDTKQGLYCTIEYNTDLLEGKTIERLLGHWQMLLEGVVVQPEQRLADLPLVTSAEHHQLLVEWNQTHVERSSSPQCIHHLFEYHAEHTPDLIAVVCNDVVLTYGELNQRANQLAYHLQHKGIGPDSLVGLYFERSVELIISVLGVLKAGGAYVPLSLAAPIERHKKIFQDAQFAVLLTQSYLAERCPSSTACLICLDTDWLSINQYPHTNLNCDTVEANLVYVIYTSGSTGVPKGVAIQHGALVNVITWLKRTYTVSAIDHICQMADIAFDASCMEIWPALISGASVYIPDEETKISPALLCNWLLSQAITIQFLPPALAKILLDMDWPAQIALRYLWTGGDRLSHYALSSLPFTFVNNYGPTEGTILATSGIVPVLNHADRAPSIGRPIANVQLYILDQYFYPVPVGLSGDLYIGGDGLARGYVGLPELTAELFLPDPFCLGPGKRLYKTGDRASYLPDGNIAFLGRIDNQVKIRGFRIETGEIEAALLEHSDVQACLVIAGENSQGDKHLLAYIVPVLQTKDTISAYSVRHFLQQKLPDYMLPSHIIFLDALPFNLSGKVDRNALPLPEESQQSLGHDNFVPPRDALEETLVGIWCQILSCKQVGIHDNFFALGGHSLLATHLVARIRTELEIDLPLRCLFETPTIAELAEIARILQQSQSPSITISPLQKDTGQILSTMEQLSDDEVAALLDEMLEEDEDE